MTFERILTLRLNTEESEQLRWLMEQTDTRTASKALIRAIGVLRQTGDRVSQLENGFDHLNKLARLMKLVASEMEAQTAEPNRNLVPPEEPTKASHEEAREKSRIRAAARERLIELVVLQKGACALCGGPLPSEARQVVIDHIVPLTLGGSSDRENLQAVCRPCNMQVGVRRGKGQKPGSAQL